MPSLPTMRAPRSRQKYHEQPLGFSLSKATHHFRLTTSGGAIEVTANDPEDTTTRDQIRMHLKHIAVAFKDGDFAAPVSTRPAIRRP